MSEHLRKSATELEQKLREQQAEVDETKKAINLLCKMMNLPEPHRLEDAELSGVQGILPDSYFGKPLATAVGEFLDLVGHAVSVSEILEGLQRGGYDFIDAKHPGRVLRISLGKNTAKFVQVRGSDSFGLKKWYPNLRTESKQKPNDTEIEVARREEEQFVEEQGRGPTNPLEPNDEV